LLLATRCPNTRSSERRRLTLQLSPPAVAQDPLRPLGRRILAWLARQHGF